MLLLIIHFTLPRCQLTIAACRRVAEVESTVAMLEKRLAAVSEGNQALFCVADCLECLWWLAKGGGGVGIAALCLKGNVLAFHLVWLDWIGLG